MLIYFFGNMVIDSSEVIDNEIKKKVICMRSIFMNNELLEKLIIL